MPDPNINKKISELPDAASLSDTDELVLARSDANYKVTGAILKAATTPAGSDTQVQFNDDGVLGAVASFIFNKASELLQATIMKATSYFQGRMGGYVVLASGDTTPSVAGTHFLVYNTDTNLTVTGLDDAINGQVITILNVSSNTLTISDFFYAASGAFAMTQHDTLTLVYYGTWKEIARSANV